MEPKKVTRSKFLRSSWKYAVGAVAGISGLSMLKENNLLANTSAYRWPYPYKKIDPEKARIKAHTLYWNRNLCCAGVFGGLVECLKETVGDPWNDFPIEIMLFGAGGGVNWGATCGTLNGAGALISLVTEKVLAETSLLINEIWGWYTTEKLPTDAANKAKYEVKKYTGELPQNISGSPLCHVSVSQWCMVAQKKVKDIERNERCARVAGDIAAKTAEVLNAYFANTFSSTFAAPEGNAVCMSCHGSAAKDNVVTYMDCATCHNDEPVHNGAYTSIKPTGVHKPSN